MRIFNDIKFIFTLPRRLDESTRALEESTRLLVRETVKTVSTKTVSTPTAHAAPTFIQTPRGIRFASEADCVCCGEQIESD